MSDFSNIKTMYVKQLKHAQSEQERRSAYDVLALVFIFQGYHAEAVLFKQLSIDLQPAKEALARAFLDGEDTSILVMAAMEEESLPLIKRKLKSYWMDPEMNFNTPG